MENQNTFVANGCTLHTTSDLSQFILGNYNRRLNQANVQRIKESIIQYGFLPNGAIFCTRDLKVLSGQHRLEAAKEIQSEGSLDLCIYYWVSDRDEEEAIWLISGLEKANASWSGKDILQFEADVKDDDQSKLILLLHKGFGLPLNVARKTVLAFGPERSKEFALYSNKVESTLKDTGDPLWKYVKGSRFSHGLIGMFKVYFAQIDHSGESKVDLDHFLEQTRKYAGEVLSKAFAGQTSAIGALRELYGYRAGGRRAVTF